MRSLTFREQLDVAWVHLLDMGGSAMVNPFEYREAMTDAIWSEIPKPPKQTVRDPNLPPEPVSVDDLTQSTKDKMKAMADQLRVMREASRTAAPAGE